MPLTLSPGQDQKLADFFRNTYLTDTEQFQPLCFQNKTLGYINKEWRERVLSDAAELFHAKQRQIILTDSLPVTLLESRLQQLCQNWYQQGIFPIFRNERFSVRDDQGQHLFLLERAAFMSFGLKSRAVHLNALVWKNNEPFFWLGRRSLSKAIAPGKLDNLMGGGVSGNETPEQALLRESFEEAGLSGQIVAKNALASGHCMSMRSIRWGMHRETIFLYLINLPETFIPRNQDGEVSEFTCLPASHIIECIIQDKFIPDAALCLIFEMLHRNLVTAPQTLLWFNSLPELVLPDQFSLF